MPIKLRAWYNPGMATTFLLFLPLCIVYIHELAGEQLLDAKTWLLAIVTLFGCILISIVIPVQSLKSEQTKYPIDAKQIQRCESIMRHCQIRRHR